ncbi:Hypp6137 [Branchiostoma lanceolatum]|uniref:Hypp6137 protein n=1 Tax=Branchiostoma lanceolatum TaxID=7740 RepID=A0A8J9WHY3_BRALA|nr:Hypp6137 [Branchiostoma lanceolatum]
MANCDLPDSLARKIGNDHNKIHFALPPSAPDRLYSCRAAAYAEAGYTDETDLTTVEPLLTSHYERQGKKKNIVKLKAFRANRFNIVFEAAAATYFHKDDIQKMRMHQEHERQTMSNMMGRPSILTAVSQQAEKTRNGHAAIPIAGHQAVSSLRSRRAFKAEGIVWE